MSRFFLKLLCLMTCLHWLFAIPSHIFPMEIYYLMYGNLLNMDKTFLPMDGIGFKDGVPVQKPNITIMEALSDEYMIKDPEQVVKEFGRKSGDSGHDSQLFDLLNSQVMNISQGTRKSGWYIWDDWWTVDPSDPDKFKRGHVGENKKKKVLRSTAMTWLLQIRYMVDKARKFRAKFVTEKRYQLGYLFNRLRRIKTEMTKLVHSGYAGDATDTFKRISLVIRIYEEVVNMDTDVRDTMWMIRKIADQIEPELVEVDPSKAKDYVPPNAPNDDTWEPI